MVPGGRFLWGLVRGGFLYFLLGGTGRGQNVLKITRKAIEIIEKSTENQLKPKKLMDFKGKVQNKLKSRQKVCKSVKKYYCGIVGGDPPQMQYFFTDFAHFLSTF